MDQATEDTRAQLDAVLPTAGIDRVFEALRIALPVDAATLQVFRESTPADITFVGFQLADSVRDAWLTDLSPDVLAILTPMLSSSVGAIFSDGVDTSPSLREHASVFRAMSAAGLDYRMALSVTSQPTRSGGTGDLEHTFLAVLSKTPLTELHAARLRALHGPLAAALARLRVPLLGSTPILRQIVREQRHGYLCISESQKVVESNSIAHRLVGDFLPGVAALPKLVSSALAAYSEEPQYPAYRVHHRQRRALLDISVHFLEPDAHALPEAMYLLLLVEVAWGATTPSPRAVETLSKRQREIAEILATTSRSYGEIAQELGLAEGTVRKHVERTYRALDVRSRAELCALWFGVEKGLVPGIS